jgi:hypothetical protein
MLGLNGFELSAFNSSFGSSGSSGYSGYSGYPVFSLAISARNDPVNFV